MEEDINAREGRRNGEMIARGRERWRTKVGTEKIEGKRNKKKTGRRK